MMGGFLPTPNRSCCGFKALSGFKNSRTAVTLRTRHHGVGVRRLKLLLRVEGQMMMKQSKPVGASLYLNTKDDDRSHI